MQKPFHLWQQRVHSCWDFRLSSFSPNSLFPKRWQLLLYWPWNPWVEKHQCEALHLWKEKYSFLSSKLDCIAYSWRTRRGQSSTTVNFDFCSLRLFYDKTERQKCSKNCAQWKKCHTVAAYNNVISMICQALYRNFDSCGWNCFFLTHWIPLLLDQLHI